MSVFAQFLARMCEVCEMNIFKRVRDTLIDSNYTIVVYYDDIGLVALFTRLILNPLHKQAT